MTFIRSMGPAIWYLLLNTFLIDQYMTGSFYFLLKCWYNSQNISSIRKGPSPLITNKPLFDITDYHFELIKQTRSSYDVYCLGQPQSISNHN